MANFGSVGYEARQTLQGGSDWLERLTRLGFISKGVVYILVGALALMAAFSRRGGETTDHHGVIEKIADQPFGEFMLVAIGIGLIGYAVWRFLCSFIDSEGKGSQPQGLAKRAGYFASGVIHISLAMAALKLAFGSVTSGGQQQSWSARVLDAPGGVLIMAALGIAIIIGGIEQFRHGWKRKFESELRLREMNPQERDLASRAGKWGYSARGVTFVLSGIFVLFAAIRHDPSEVRGLEGALDTLAAQPFGSLLMAIIAAGLVGYGAYCFVAAKYRRIHI